MPASPVTIAAALIVRDEEFTLPTCLASIRGLVDEIVVHDTGSVDATVAVAHAAGARVLHGEWRDDFSWARNVVLAEVTDTWILSIDADETAVVDAAALRRLLADTGPEVEAFAVQISSTAGPDVRGLVSHTEVKLFRRQAGHYIGRVHEQVVRADGEPLQVATLPPHVLCFLHAGYSDADVAAAKALRNARLCELELETLSEIAPDEPDALARVALDLGRSFMGCGRRVEAVGALQLVRSLPARGTEWAWATDLLLRMALDDGEAHVALALADELTAHHLAPQYCAWARAQELGQLGRAEECYQLLTSITEIRDLSGRPLDHGQVLELTALAAAHSGRMNEALDLAEVAVVRYGRPTVLPG